MPTSSSEIHRIVIPASSSPTYAERLARQVLTLQLAWLAGSVPPLLRGKHLCVVCGALDGPDAIEFDRAATELGAQVSHIRPSVAGLLVQDNAVATAEWLGRLYDAIECQGLPSEVVGNLRRHCGVPILEAAAESGAFIVPTVDGVNPLRSRRCALQAFMVVAMDSGQR